MWLYKNKEFTSEDIGDAIGMVYCVTHIPTGKKYIGKKKFWSKRRAPPLKGKKRRRTIIKESDWQTYHGSSEIVKEMVEAGDLFSREVIHLCYSLGEMNYMELHEQVTRGVLFSDDYFNGIIQVKIHKSHVGKMKNPGDRN